MLKPEEHDLDSYLTHFEIIQLWASPKYDHVDVAQYEKLIWQAVTDGDLLAEVSIRNPKALGGFEVIPYSPTTLRQARDGVLGKSFVQFTIHRDKFREWFVKSNQCPLVDDCLLAKWFETETVPDAGADSQGNTEPASTKIIQYEQYKNSLDALNIDLTPLTVENIFKQVQLTDKTLWSITLATFRRDVWPKYSKANGILKQRGRPRTK